MWLQGSVKLKVWKRWLILVQIGTDVNRTKNCEMNDAQNKWHVLLQSQRKDLLNFIGLQADERVVDSWDLIIKYRSL